MKTKPSYPGNPVVAEAIIDYIASVTGQDIGLIIRDDEKAKDKAAAV